MIFNFKTKLIAFAVILTLLFAAFAAGCAPRDMMSADWPYYASVQELLTDADDVITGEVISAGEVRMLYVAGADRDPLPYTVSSVRVTSVVKGGLAVGDVIEVKQLGDSGSDPESTLAEIDGYFTQGAEQLLFLRAYEGSPYSTLCPAQGAVEIRGGRLYSLSRYSLFGYGEHETLETVLEELKALAG